MNTKFFLQSKTILGALLIVVTTVAPLLGFSFTADDAGVIGANVGTIIDSVGVLLVIWGRLTASTALTVTK